MSAHTACPRPPVAPELPRVRPTVTPAEPIQESGAGGLFDRLFDAWAERVERIWHERGWRDVHDRPPY